MRRCLMFVGLIAILHGCHHPKYDLAAKYPEEFIVPPNEPRFDNPPESEYRKPLPKKDFTPGPGMGGPSGVGGPKTGGGMGGPGMGGY
jgi:hypothetical protein